MNLQDFKITVILAILFGLFHSSCQMNEFDTSLIFDEPGEFQYQKETAFCRSNPDIEIWSKTFTYDNNGNTIEEMTFNNGTPDLKVRREFNANSQQLTDSTFYFLAGIWQFQHSNQFIYNRNLLSEKLLFDADGKNTHKIIYKYQESTLKWEEFWYFSDNKWEFQYAFGFDFNHSGKLIKKESFQTVEKNKVYDTFIYAYKNGKLVEEKRIIRTGEISYIKKFTYTSEGLPFETIQDKNVIEKNCYTNGTLTEKHTFYFGIDPGFMQCNGNLIYKYGY